MYNTKEEFLVDFQKWREQNGLPKREQCREMFREYRECELGTVSSNIFDYILEQEKPGMFLDSLFKKGNSVCDSDPKPEVEKIVQEPKKSDEDYKLEIINAFYAYAQENKSVPSFKILNSQLGYKVQKYFQDEKDLYYACATVYDVQDYLLNEASFSPEYTRKTLDIIKQHKRFLVTTAVSGKKCNKLLLKSMLNYCERKDAIILVLPSQDVFNRKSKFEFELDPELKHDRIRVIYEDTYLNSNFYLSSVKVSAKAVYPLTGLDYLCKYGTTVIGNVKQDCNPVANLPTKTPNFIMCSGSCTEPNFENDAYMCQRLNRLAEEDFVSGCIVVEVESEHVFHFRQMQMDKNGGICDLGEMFTPGGDRYFLYNSVITFGDLHSEDLDPNVFECEKEIVNIVGAKTAVLHDITSFSCISHHNEGKYATQAIMADDNKISLKDTIRITSNVLEEICDMVDEVVIVDSNHHSHLQKYLDQGRFIFDKINTKYAVGAFVAMLDGEEIPLRYLVEREMSEVNFDKIKWLEKNEGYEKYDTELSNHGHISQNGGRGNALRTYRKIFKSSISAHTHSPKISGNSMCVGMSTKKFIGYNVGISSWMPSVAILMSNGKKQMINIIEKDGKYSWRI